MMRTFILTGIVISCMFSAAYAQFCPAYSLGPDTLINCGASVALHAPAGWSNYLWNTGATTPNISTSTPGNYWCRSTDTLANVVVNYDFSAGDSGFSSDYTVGTSGPWGPLSYEGTYMVSTNANLTHSNFSSCFDHTTGVGTNPMMVVNGAPILGQRIWYQTVPVTPNTDYVFSVWFTSVDPNSPAILQFSVNSTNLGSPFTLSPITCFWQNFSYVWNSGANTSVEISIRNQNTSTSGNDFAIDDITFAPICIKQDTIHVSNPPHPVPAITGATTFCSGDTSTLTVNNGPFSTYAWSNGDADSVANIVAGGTYTVTVTDANACTGTASVLVNMQNPVVTISAAPNLCNGDSVLMNANPAAAFTSFVWSNGDATSGSYAYGPGTYSVTVTTALGCTATNSVTINLLPGPDGNIVLPPAVCNGQPVTFGVNSTGTPITNYYWDFGVSALGDNSNAAAPVYTYPNSASGTGYQVSVILTANNGCTDTLEATLVIGTAPQATINLPPTICEGGVADFSLVVSGDSVAQYQWVFPGGNPSSSAAASPQIGFPAPGVIPVQVVITTAEGCTATVSQDYLVKANPNADFEVYPICISRFTFDPTGAPDDATTVLDWSMGDGTQYNDRDTSFFNHIFSAPGTYQVQLIVTDTVGCRDTIVKPVQVLDNMMIDAPTVLYRSSNIENDKVDLEFKYPGFNLCIDYTYSVYNRWGVKVFETHNNPQDPDLFCNKCFTGNDQNGNTLSAGVYYFILEGNFNVHHVGYITVLD